MKISSIIKWSGLGFITYKAIRYVSNKVTTVQALTSNISGVKFKNIHFPFINFIISVQVTNPTNNDATATSFTGNLTAPNGNTLGSFNVLLNNVQCFAPPCNSGIVVPAKSNAVLNVDAKVDVFGVASSILQDGLKAQVNGVVVVDGFKIPVIANVEIGTSGIKMS